MIAVDTNVLIHAHRSESSKHRKAKERLTALAESREPWSIPVFCFGEFIRVVTHKKVFSPPHAPDKACQSISSLLGSPSLIVLKPENQFFPILFEIIREHQIKGNQIFDAQIAALCIEAGVRSLLTEDSDFKKFKDLTILHL